MSTAQRYRLSGKLGRAPIVFIGVSFALAAAIAWLCGSFDLSIPRGKLRVLGYVLLGLLHGAGTAWLAMQLRCRSVATVVSATLLAALFSIYLGTAVYLETLFAQMNAAAPSTTVSYLITHPAPFWDTLVQVSNAGIFTAKGRVVSSGSLWIEWIFSAAGFLIPSVLIAYFNYHDKIFCEDCLCWVDFNTTTVKLVPIEDTAAVAAGDLSALRTTPRIGPDVRMQFPHLSIKYALCKTCGNTGAYRINQVERTKDDGDKESSRSPLMALDAQSAVVLGEMLSDAKRA